jgi:hypothetical protein
LRHIRYNLVTQGRGLNEPAIRRPIEAARAGVSSCVRRRLVVVCWVVWTTRR